MMNHIRLDKDILYIILDGDLTAIDQPSCSRKFNTQSKRCFMICSLRFLCNTCRARKAAFCKNYHLVGKARWSDIIKNKFHKLSWLTPKISEYAAYDIELQLRQLFENTYDISCDPGHAHWKNKLMSKSIIQFSSCNINLDYWTRLIFTIIEQDIINYDGASLISLDLHNFKSISKPKNALLDILCIDYSVNKIELLEIVRVGNYGMSCEKGSGLYVRPYKGGSTKK